MLVLDTEKLRKCIDDLGVKQKVIAEKANMTETALCLVVQGKRKCEAGEYASLCRALNVPISRFLKEIESSDFNKLEREG